MNKCDFCSCGPRSNPSTCFARGSSSCNTAANRYMKVCMSQNSRTTTHNKNVNVHKNTNYKGKNGR